MIKLTNIVIIYIYLYSYSSLDIGIEATNSFYNKNFAHALIEVTRNELYLNPDFDVLQYANVNNSTDTFLKWNFTDVELLEGYVNIKYTTSGRETDRAFKICPLYQKKTYSNVGQELLFGIFVNFERSWLETFLDLLRNSRCPSLDSNMLFLNPEYIRMEIWKPADMECNKKISLTLTIFSRDSGKKLFPIIASAKYNGSVKCPDEKQSYQFLFYTRNAYLTDAFMN